ncbi:GNAT family N-acetyltransferase [Ciceribacter lividus]|nr:GNAT family N-acetyltransferase [Ciceribacter lividus]
MSYILRDTRSTDVSSMATIYADAVVTGTASYELVPPTREEMASRFAEIIGRGYPHIAAVDEDGAFLGYAYASAFRTRPAYRWLVEDSIYLAREAQGRGIGKALLQELARRCTALGFRQMVAVIGGASPASVRLHSACGFQLTGTLIGTGFKHGRWLDTVLMQLPLGDGNATVPDEDSYPGCLFVG